VGGMLEKVVDSQVCSICVNSEAGTRFTYFNFKIIDFNHLQLIQFGLQKLFSINKSTMM